MSASDRAVNFMNRSTGQWSSQL